MSMLDVIASALGAFLLLFLMTMKTNDALHAQARAKDEEIERLQQKIREASAAAQAAVEAARRAEEAASEARARAAALERRKRLEGIAKGIAIGMCEVSVAQVRVSVWDKGKQDGDKVTLKLNEQVIESSYHLTTSPRTLTLSLEPGLNYLVAQALNTGSKGANTAAVRIDPCRDGRPQDFTWDMQTGDIRNVSIIRR